MAFPFTQKTNSLIETITPLFNYTHVYTKSAESFKTPAGEAYMRELIQSQTIAESDWMTTLNTLLSNLFEAAGKYRTVNTYI